MILCAVRRTPLRAFGRSLALPSAVDALAQIVIGVVDNAVAAAIIWLLMPPGAVHYLTFVGAYAVAVLSPPPSRRVYTDEPNPLGSSVRCGRKQSALSIGPSL